MNQKTRKYLQKEAEITEARNARIREYFSQAAEAIIQAHDRTDSLGSYDALMWVKDPANHYCKALRELGFQLEGNGGDYYTATFRPKPKETGE